MLRLFVACFCSLLLLGLIPYLNKSRTANELPVASFRLHSFETKLAPPPETVPEAKTILEEEKAIPVSSAIPKPSLIPSIILAPTMTTSDFKFTSSVMTGEVLSGGNGFVIAEESLKPSVEGFVLQLDGGDHLLYGPKPNTPLRAQQLRLNGNVMAEFEVNEKGLVENIKISKSSDSMFDKAVIAALKQYRFKPYQDKNGVFVRVALSREFQFENK